MCVCVYVIIIDIIKFTNKYDLNNSNNVIIIFGAHMICL